MLTANRATTIVFEPVTQTLLNYPPWYLKRKAHEIARGERRDRRAVSKCRLEGTIDAWRLVNTLDELGRVTTTDFSSSALGESAFNMAEGVSAFDTYRKPTETGINAGASVLANAAPSFRRAIAQGGDWSTGLTITNAPTPDEPDSIPMVRMLAGLETYPPNCGFALIVGWGVLGGGWFNGGWASSIGPPGSLLQLQFGGPTERQPADADGGEYCLDLRSDAKALLWEKPSRVRMEIPLPNEEHLGFLWAVQPLGKRHLLIYSSGALDRYDPQKLQAFRRGWLPAIAYRHTKALTGTEPVRYLSGAGTIALDVRRDFRGTISLSRSKFHPEGYIQDLDLLLPWPVIPAGTVLTLKLDAELVPGTEITAQLFDATDDSEITVTGDPISATNPFATYTLAANQGKLYLKFTLTGDGDQTPLLYGYEVEVTGLSSTRTPTPITGGTLRSVSISGPDLDPSAAQAKAVIADLEAELNSLLLVRGGVHTQIKTQYDSLGSTTVLHEGLLLDARARMRGKAGMTYPSPNRRDFDLTIGSMWVKLQRQLNLSPEQFGTDPNAAENPSTGDRPPWKITDIMSYGFRKCGIPDEQLDIPDLPIRLWPTKDTASDLILYPTTSWAEFLLKLAKDYLGMVLLWDPNAGSSNGMWRLIYHPAAPYSPLATFVGAPAAGRLVSHPNSYSTAQTFIIDKTYESWTVPPEANFIIVTSTGELLPGDGGSKQTVARIYNPLSFNWDPSAPTADSTHPDYLGEFVPLVHFDPTLSTPEAVAYVARRLYDRVAHGEKWFTFQAPALYVGNAADAELLGRKRPLRINDVITVLGSTAMVRSASYGYDRDVRQLMTIEGRFIT